MKNIKFLLLSILSNFIKELNIITGDLHALLAELFLPLPELAVILPKIRNQLHIADVPVFSLFDVGHSRFEQVVFERLLKRSQVDCRDPLVPQRWFNVVLLTLCLKDIIYCRWGNTMKFGFIYATFSSLFSFIDSWSFGVSCEVTLFLTY